MKAPKLKRVAFDDGVLSSGFLTRDRTLLVEGTAVAKSTVTIFDDGVKIGTAKADKSGNWSFATPSLRDGAHNFTASAKLKKDASKPSKGFAGVVDATAPAKPGIDLASASDTGSSATDNITRDATPTLTGTAEAGATVTIKDGATVLGTAAANGAGQWTFTTAALANGAHSLTVTATDKAGNVSAPSAALVVTVDTVPPTAPTLLHLAPADDTGSSNTDNRTKLTSGLTITGSSTENGATVTLFDDADNDGVKDVDEAVLNTGVVSGGVFSIDVALASGPHHVRGFIADAAGNVAVSTALDITVDTTAPTHGSVVFDDVDGRISPAEAAAAAYTVAGIEAGATATVTFTSSSGGTPVVVAGVGNGSFAADLSGLSDGIVSVAIAVTDAAGNAGAGTGDTSRLDVLLDISVASADFVAVGQGFRVFGSYPGDAGGGSVSSAGDINADGFDDLIIGAYGLDRPEPSGPSQSNVGEAFVLFGKAGGFTDLATALTAATEGVHILGPSTNYYTGWSVASAGDVNADGIDDMIIGAINSANGQAFVVFGRATGLTNIDLRYEVLAASGNGFSIIGDVSVGHAGWSVSSAGDVNGDGIDDLIIGGDFKSSVVFGSAMPPTDAYVSSLASTGRGFNIYSPSPEGRIVSSAGDFNGDGFGDILVGMSASDTGAAYLLLGRESGFADINLPTTDLAATSQGFRIVGADIGDLAGASFSSAGDLNGDGFDDLIIGAPAGDGAGNGLDHAGEAIVVFGHASGLADIDVGSATFESSGQGFRIFGESIDDFTGLSVSSAGDVNGDGFDDLIIGAPGASVAFGSTAPGRAIVVFGKASGFGNIDLATTDLAATGAGFTITGGDNGDFAGGSVASAGDIDGDGFDDLIIGASGGDGKQPPPGLPGPWANAGQAIVIYGADFLGGVVHVGGDGNETFTGTSAAETFVAGRGNDSMVGNGGADAFNGGAGSDWISVGDLDFRKVDGGSGTDTLHFDFAGAVDFTAIADNRIKGIEAIDFSGGDANTVVLRALDVLHFSDTPHAGFSGADSHKRLVIHLGQEDTLALEDLGAAYQWSQVKSQVHLDGSAGGDFTFYNLVHNSAVIASIAIDVHV